VTIVVAGAVREPVAADPTAYRAAVADREADGTPRKEAIVQVARAAGVPKREVYDAVHRDREEGA
jgi:16S rRNA (cytidine1402-2'-O)-methyltransferase